MSLDARLRAVVAGVLGVPAEHVNDEGSPGTIGSWDSIHHIQLVVALEAEFGVQFDPDEIAELTSVSVIRARLEQAGVG